MVLPYIIVGSFLPVTAGGAISFTVDLLANPHSDTPAAGLAVLWLIALVNAGVLALVVHFRRQRRRRWRAIADAIAARLTGRVWTTGREWVAWLNAMWAGPYAITSLLLGPYFHAVTGGLGGFTVAVDLAQRALAMGFSLSSCTGGLVATGRDAMPTLTQSPPDVAAEALAVAARLLVEWAGRVGAVAATPLP
jgi:hypothetical protein